VNRLLRTSLVRTPRSTCAALSTYQEPPCARTCTSTIACLMGDLFICTSALAPLKVCVCTRFVVLCNVVLFHPRVAIVCLAPRPCARYLKDRLHEQITGLLDPRLPQPLSLDHLCQVYVPVAPPPPRLVHDHFRVTGRGNRYRSSRDPSGASTSSAKSPSTPTATPTFLTATATPGGGVTVARRQRVILPYRFHPPASVSPDVFGPAPPLPRDEPPLFIIVRKRRRYIRNDLKGELARQAAKFRNRKQVLLQKHILTQSNSFKCVCSCVMFAIVWCCVLLGFCGLDSVRVSSVALPLLPPHLQIQNHAATGQETHQSSTCIAFKSSCQKGQENGPPRQSNASRCARS